VNDALYLPPTRQAFRRLENLGLLDAVRCLTDAVPHLYVLGLPGRSWPKNFGIRIDHLHAVGRSSRPPRLDAVEKHVRGWEKPSDHVPVVAIFDYAA
jgi:exodeoxyribonuclease-3